MEKKYVVPEGMLQAFKDSLDAQNAFVVDGHEGNREYAIEPALEAVLGWLAEHAIVPTDEQDHDLAEWSEEHPTECPFVEWQRRMFLDPEPPTLEERIAKILIDHGPDSPAGYRSAASLIAAELAKEVK